MSQALQALDRIVRRSKRKDSREEDDQALQIDIARWIVRVHRGDAALDGDEPQTLALEVLGKAPQLIDRKRLAVCLLRLLPEPSMKWLHYPPWRAKIVSLFDSELSGDLYKERRIDPAVQSHLKLELLAKAFAEQEDAIKKAVATLTSLDRINPHRQALMGALNSKTGRILFQPFLPGDSEPLIAELFARAESYLQQKDGPEAIDAFTKANTEIDRFVAKFRAHDTYYSILLADSVALNIGQFLTADFAQNPAAQPCTLGVRGTEKKYPLHRLGEIDIRATVTNYGPGHAHGVLLTLLTDESVLRLRSNEVDLDRIPPGDLAVRVPGEVLAVASAVTVLAQLSWRHLDGSGHTIDGAFELFSQKRELDWDALAQTEPYSLEAVTNEQELVGRKDVLNRLLGSLQSSNVGSCVIHGQKRVGKTSIARAVQSRLQASGALVVYLEGGDYVEPRAEATIARLGLRLCKEIRAADAAVSKIPLPVFEDSLSPFVEFVDSVLAAIPDKKLILILDEFDELPLELYERSAVGNGFFLNLRSISSRRRVGFVLVGGEKMAHILDCHGQHLNKWKVVPVDYFMRDADWDDYKELVQRPTTGTLEFTDDAVRKLQDNTAGNPYFTKLICQYAFTDAVRRRDASIGRAEVERAVDLTIGETDRNAFQHFWDDGIVETGERAVSRSVRRRRILIVVSDIIATRKAPTKSAIAAHQLVRELETLDADLAEFTGRNVLVEDARTGTYEFKVPFFQGWLRSRGVNDIITTFTTLTAELRQRQHEELLKIQPQEVVAVVRDGWLYKGQRVGEDRVRTWLAQFGEERAARAMFTVLQHLRYYSDAYVRGKMIEAQQILQRRAEKRPIGKQKRSDVLISYLDGTAKSGAHFARIFADEAGVYVDNVVEKGRVTEFLLANSQVHALVFLDDFVGTGDSVVDNFGGLDKFIAEIARDRELTVLLLPVVAFFDGLRKIEAARTAWKTHVEVLACEILDETAMSFGDRSTTFPDQVQRECAKEIAVRYGKRLAHRWPLGYGEFGLAVVFERGCPNNTLPILWAESSSWVPLFKR